MMMKTTTLMKIKSILVSQPAPNTESSPYLELAKSEKIKIQFTPFIHIQGVDSKELRTQKIDFSAYTGVVFNSRNAVDHYFRLAEEMRFSVPDSMRYICQTEAIANYLQKHIIYRKRKISFGIKTAADMLPLLKKHNTEKYLLPSSDVLNDDIQNVLHNSGVDWTRAIMYKTVSSELSEIKIKNYDMLVFFSPHGVTSIFQNFPDYEQGNQLIAVFGMTTQNVALEHGLEVNVMAPTAENPSMAMAIEKFIRNISK